MRAKVVAVAVAVVVLAGCGGPSGPPHRAHEGTLEEFCAAYRSDAPDLDLSDDAAVRALASRVLATPHPPELVDDADLHVQALTLMSERALEVPAGERGEAMAELLATDERVQEGRAAADRIATYARDHCGSAA